MMTRPGCLAGTTTFETAGGMIMSDTLKYYLQDCMKELAERARAAKAEADLTKDSFDIGRVSGYCAILSYLRNQALGFGIPYEEIGLDGIDPDKELM
jgi:hypothetical protein